MGIRSFLSKPYAAYIVKQQLKWANNPSQAQESVFQNLITIGKTTAFGKDHHFADIKNYEDFKKHVPICDYEDLRPYIDRVIAGESDVLWRDKPTYFAKTSGTTSGAKYIPLTKDSIPNHINSAKNAMLNYIHETGNADFLDRKLIFLSGSPVLGKSGDILSGRLSGIVNHHVPGYLRTNQMPSYETNCIEDWETKLDRIIDETIHQDMSLISGIPPWVQMYFDRIIERTGKPIHETFPNFDMFIYGGVNFEPYKTKLFDSIGKVIPSIETYPASEGFFAFQDTQTEEGLLMQLDSGIFFEFIPTDEYFEENPTRLRIEEVEIGKNYALIINSNAGLWGYSIGDTVKFVSKSPYRVLVTGRIKHFISAFGEHVIGTEVEKAMKYALEQHPEVKITEFSVAPQVNPTEGLPYHEWLISYENEPNDPDAFALTIDNKLRELNVYYDDLITGSITRTLVISALQRDAFQQYMKSIGKLGGQNKVPRLSNDRKIADKIIHWKK
ncbi:GH3 auxin-responsive promoter family protein [Flammeovirga kamogawensis]|uniref:GH3 auxin-responsive promoter family protein n=1 Tax=Flammeovirga kamogawensis TaxID=373891 RepID=A0ABX8GSA2_9BACT|nr:GH3 auxin-responsive promoter family protein [Flammeovirga kamogawensis]MBB6462106.1 phenylacetate-coenzyme A ligase PaaK-like adenylate-forming protein [Flammeovirga kamogawensis]QWG05840.1 GH3 auxin-responsive promoter family protein [Flammeovirga kamogawensis]TRX67665.1 GH3 auxin-responsive promoter family protein [Flammeovirga kamogawensis]